MIVSSLHRGRPRITARAGSALDQAEEALGLRLVRRATIDWRLARICNHYVTRPPRTEARAA